MHNINIELRGAQAYQFFGLANLLRSDNDAKCKLDLVSLIHW